MNRDKRNRERGRKREREREMRSAVVGPTAPFPWTIKYANDVHSHVPDKLNGARVNMERKGRDETNCEIYVVCTNSLIFKYICMK